ncbi:hypothetical protein MASR2M78_35220 [Treponema sp.]
MQYERPLDLSAFLDHSDSAAVQEAVKNLFNLSYPGASFDPIEKVFRLCYDLYHGSFPGYSACRVGYHDFRHTVDVFVAVSRLLDGCVLLGSAPSPLLAAETLIAALLHDVGYVQEAGDDEGTGAKYTKTHVHRSVEFTAKYQDALGLDEEGSARVSRLIYGTDLALDFAQLPYQNLDERLAATVLASSDLLGQMADRSYLEKLLFLYYEFREAGFGGYDSAFDILRKTSIFYASTKIRLDITLAAVAPAARKHFAVRSGEDRDIYREMIARQMSYLDSIMEDDSVNFRHRLRRMALEEIELAEKTRLAAFGVKAVMDIF